MEDDEMRNGEITIEHAGSGDIDIVFSKDGIYTSCTVTWVEAQLMAQLLTHEAAQHKEEALNQQWCDTLNGLDDAERKVIRVE